MSKILDSLPIGGLVMANVNFISASGVSMKKGDEAEIMGRHEGGGFILKKINDNRQFVVGGSLLTCDALEVYKKLIN